MNETAERPEWLQYVEYYAINRSAAGLPSLESEFGPGHWKIDGSRARITDNGLLRYYVYWLDGKGRHHRIGTFDAPYINRKQGKRGLGALTLGSDEYGRRLVRITIDKHCQQYRIVAVEWEVVRGVKLPRPIPIQE